MLQREPSITSNSLGEQLPIFSIEPLKAQRLNRKIVVRRRLDLDSRQQHRHYDIKICRLVMERIPL